MGREVDTQISPEQNPEAPVHFESRQGISLITASSRTRCLLATRPCFPRVLLYSGTVFPGFCNPSPGH